jgi:DNA-binding SARP family transcriptional activator
VADRGQPAEIGRAVMIGVLGSIRFVGPGGPGWLASPSQRRLVALLASRAPEPVRTELLAELLGMSPSGLRTTVTRVRRAIGDSVVVSSAGGYRLVGAVDAHEFCRRLAAVPVAATSGPEDRVRALERTLALWRGRAFDEFAHEEWAAGEAARLEELHAAAAEAHAEALVETRRWSDAIAALAPHIVRHPLRDRPRGLLMRALAGDGRQADALRAAREYRHLLAEEVGTEPSAAFQRIEHRIAGDLDDADVDVGDGRLLRRGPRRGGDDLVEHRLRREVR